MTQKLRQHLKKRREDAVREAEKRLQTDDTEDIDRLIQQISMYSSSLSALPVNRLTEGVVASLVWLLCASVVGLAWGIRVPETRIVLTVESHAVNMDLTEAFDWSEELSIQPGGVRIYDMEVLKLPERASRMILTGSAWADIVGNQLQLSALKRSLGGEFSIELTDGGVEMRSKNAAFNGEFTVSGNATLSAGILSGIESSNYSLSLDFPERISFNSHKSSAVPGVLRFGLNEEEELVLYDLQIQGLRLSQLKTNKVGSDQFVSSIIDGSVQLSDISESVDLNAHEPLLLSGVSGRISELRINNVIRTRFDGVVEEIFTGPEGFRTDLRPTVLQFIYHQQPLSFFFGAVTFLWGIFWSARKLLFSKY